MHMLRVWECFSIFTGLSTLFILPVVQCSSSNAAAGVEIANIKHDGNTQKLSPKLSSQVIAHAFLLWASVGFLMPIGILIIKMSSTQKCGRRLQLLCNLHVIAQILSVSLTSIAAALSFKNFPNAFKNNHQRIGLALYIMVWAQLLIGFFRPKERGCKKRSMWFFVHWLIGTTITVMGTANIYIGLQAYHARTSKNVSVWSILFTIEVALIAFLYLLQDKWVYIRKQGAGAGAGAGAGVGDEPAKLVPQVNIQNDMYKDLEQRTDQLVAQGK